MGLIYWVRCPQCGARIRIGRLVEVITCRSCGWSFRPWLDPDKRSPE